MNQIIPLQHNPHPGNTQPVILNLNHRRRQPKLPEHAFLHHASMARHRESTFLKRTPPATGTATSPTAHADPNSPQLEYDPSTNMRRSATGISAPSRAGR
ncbi:hypothetical protein [Kribbella sp. NPDC050470]|uniref:hypothetical protein n=1 Tax=unclassified Kribbella TaxID=2644121 RepID=UPI003794F082